MEKNDIFITYSKYEMQSKKNVTLILTLAG